MCSSTLQVPETGCDSHGIHNTINSTRVVPSTDEHARSIFPGQRARDKMASSRRINSLAAHLGLQSTVVALPVAGGGKCRIAICGARPPRCCPSPSPGLSFPLSSSLSPLSLLCLPGAPASLVGGERQAGNAGGWADRGGCTGKTRGGW